MVEETNKLFVGNLPYSVDDTQLRELFEADGFQIVEARVISDRETGRSRGFGFVTVSSQEEAEKAANEYNGKKELEGRALVVNIARPIERDRNAHGSNRGDFRR